MKTFKLEIDLGNDDAMRTRSDIAKVLAKVAIALRDRHLGRSDGKILDLNGNTVGKWEIVK